MTRIGLIGLGVMGAPMARNIAKAGLPLTVYNRSPDPAREFEGTDVRVAASVEDVLNNADAVVLMLKDSNAIDAMLARSGLKFDVAIGGKTIINTATVAPVYSQALGADIAAAGGIYVEAPVSGSRAPAEAGELLVMAAGERGDVEKADPIFRAIGKETVYCGGVPRAMAMKSASNVLLAGVMGGLAEAVNFADGTGLDLDLFSKVILGGPMASDFLKMKLPRAIAGEYAPQAAIKNVAYSLDVMLEAARQSDVAIPGAATMRATCEKALHMGLGDEDVLALIKVLKSQRAGSPS